MAGGNPRPACIVVADDEPALLALLEVALGQEAGAVVTARDGAAAWQAIQQHRPDVAVLDADMPLLGGLDVARLVRADPTLMGTRVVLITGHAEMGAAADEPGIDRVVEKPFLPTELRRAVRELAAGVP